MPSIIKDTVFKEPTGGVLALVYLSGALLFIGQYGYYTIIANSTPGRFILFMCAGFGLSGIAESLPKNRRRAAGLLRLTAILVLICFLAIMFLAPEYIIG